MGTFTKKISLLSQFFPLEIFFEIWNFLATRFVCLVLAGLKRNSMRTNRQMLQIQINHLVMKNNEDIAARKWTARQDRLDI
jgi:hypothetical protein